MNRDDSINGYCRQYEWTYAAIIAFGYATARYAANILKDTMSVGRIGASGFTRAIVLIRCRRCATRYDRGFHSRAI
jgi:hypothetical protein